MRFEIECSTLAEWLERLVASKGAILQDAAFRRLLGFIDFVENEHVLVSLVTVRTTVPDERLQIVANLFGLSCEEIIQRMETVSGRKLLLAGKLDI